jgi:hypothetical protein
MAKDDEPTDKPAFEKVWIDAELYDRLEQKFGKDRVDEEFRKAVDDYLAELDLDPPNAPRR